MRKSDNQVVAKKNLSWIRKRILWVTYAVVAFIVLLNFQFYVIQFYQPLVMGDKSAPSNGRVAAVTSAEQLFNENKIKYFSFDDNNGISVWGFQYKNAKKLCLENINGFEQHLNKENIADNNNYSDWEKFWLVG